MKIINPLKITEQNLTASNVATGDYPEWVSGTNYVDGELIVFDNGIYQYIEIGSEFDNTIPPPFNPDHWIFISAINRFRMFDGVIGNVTTNINTIDVEITPNDIINGLAFFNLKGSSIRVTVDDNEDGLVYDETQSLQDNGNISDWYAYFFEPIVSKTEAVFLDLPNYRGAKVRIIVDAGDGLAQVGEVAVGSQRLLGITNYGGTSTSIRDYSRKDVDQFGNFIITQRRFSKRADYDITVETGKVAAVQRALAEIRTTPVVYIGEDNKTETIIYGFYRDFNIVLDGPAISSCNLEVEGLV